MAIPFIYKAGRDGGPNSLTVFFGTPARPYTILSSAPLFLTALEALKAGDEAKLSRALEVKKALLENDKFKLYDDAIFFDGVQLGHKMFDRIAAVFKTGLDITPIVKFLERVHANPSQTARDELYLFLEHNNLPITDDGHFLAYKVINADYTDCHTGKMDNSVGATVRLDRDKCDPYRDNVCAPGLHFCSRSYIGTMWRSSGRRLVVLKIDPANVVSIPSDYNNSKGRACEYLILEEIGENDHLPDNFKPSVTDYNPATAEDESEEDEDTCDSCGQSYDDCECESESCSECGEFHDDCTCEEEEEDEGTITQPVRTKSGGLTPQKVRDIRAALESDEFKSGDWTYTHIGKMHGVHRSTVQRIHKGLSHSNTK